MRSKDKFVQKFALNAMLSTMAGTAWLPKPDDGLVPSLPSVSDEVEHSEEFCLVENLATSFGKASVTISEFAFIDEWTPFLEKEFRSLALAEAKRELTGEMAERLEHLTARRNELAFPRTVDEVLLQLRRDKIMDKLAKALEEYVEFKQAAGETR